MKSGKKGIGLMAVTKSASLFMAPSQGYTDEPPLDVALLPAWTPKSVRNAIQKLGQMNLTFDYRPTLQRLAFDPRMQIVWRELLKRGASGEFTYPVQLRNPPDLRTANEQQSAALSEIFLYVLIVAYEKYPAAKPGEIVTTRDNSLWHAGALRAVAADMALALLNGQLGLTDTLVSMQLAENDRLALLRVANWLENSTRALRQPNDPLMVERHRGDRVERGVHISIANKLFLVFGKRLDRTAATLASVALGVKIGVRPARSALTRKATSKKRKAHKSRKVR